MRDEQKRKSRRSDFYKILQVNIFSVTTVITEETDSFYDEITGLIRKSNCTKSFSSSLFVRLQAREYSDKEFITILYQ